MPRIRKDLVFSCLSSLCAGTLYAYSVYSPSLKQVYSETEIGMIGAIGDFGLYLGFGIGRLYDARGPKMTLRVGAVLLAVGYAFLYILVQSALRNGGASKPPAGMLAFAFFLSGQGSAACYISGLSTALRNTATASSGSDDGGGGGGRRGGHGTGSVAGLLACVFGLSSAIYGTIYEAASLNARSFLLLLAVSLPIVTSTCSHFLKLLPAGAAERPGGSLLVTDARDGIPVDGARGTESHGSLGEGIALAAGSVAIENAPGGARSLDDGDENSDRDQNRDQGRDRFVQEDPDAASDVGVAAHAGSDGSLELLAPSDGTAATLAHASRQTRPLSPAAPLEQERDSARVTARDLLTSLDFYLVWIALGLSAGAGLMFINAMSILFIALGGEDGEHAPVIITFSTVNALSRLAYGFGSDLAARRGVPRSMMLMASCIQMALSQLVVAFVSRQGLYLAAAAVGASYGAVFTMTPVVVGDRFGLPSFGFVWGFCTLAPATFGLTLGLVGGRIYDAQVPKGQETCIGSHCFRGAFILNASLCAIAALSALVFARRNHLKSSRARNHSGSAEEGEAFEDLG